MNFFVSTAGLWSPYTWGAARGLFEHRSMTKSIPLPRQPCVPAQSVTTSPKQFMLAKSILERFHFCLSWTALLSTPSTTHPHAPPASALNSTNKEKDFRLFL